MDTVATGFDKLDEITTGLRQTSLTFLGGRPGIGKTSFALSVALDTAIRQGKTVYYLTLEASREHITAGLLSQLSSVNIGKLHSRECITPGLLSQLSSENIDKLYNDTKYYINPRNINYKELNDLQTAGKQLSEAKIYIDDNSATSVPAIKESLEKLGHVDLVIIDYLQLLRSPEKRSASIKTVKEILSSLSWLAIELCIPILVLSQLPRKFDMLDDVYVTRRARLYDLKEQYPVFSKVDIVMALYRDSYYDPDDGDKNAAECILVKNVFGKNINRIKLSWNGKLAVFRSVI